MNVTETSALIELLVGADRVTEAAAAAEDTLKREAYPTPKVFR